MDTTYRYSISQYGQITEAVLHVECAAKLKDDSKKYTVRFHRMSGPIFDIECEHCHSDKAPEVSDLCWPDGDHTY